MHLYLAASGSVTALIYQPPLPWGASDGPVIGEINSINQSINSKYAVTFDPQNLEAGHLTGHEAS